MLHKETVSEGTLDLIHRLMADEQLKDFYLVGGTALSLMIGHRISIDIDLFTDKNFDAPVIAEYLKSKYETEVRSVNKNSISGFLEGIKFDLISHRYPHVKPIEIIEGIRMLSLNDIAAMKVNAIVGNGTRIKDFIDIYYLLKQISYGQVIESYVKKYPDVSPRIARASLLYHKDIDFTMNITLLKDRVSWPAIEKGIRSAISAHDKKLNQERFMQKIKKAKKDTGNDMGGPKR